MSARYRAAESVARERKTPQQSVERRAGPRHGPVISGDPEMGPLARRARRCGASAPAPVGALLPSFSSGVETHDGQPAPSPKPAAERWLRTCRSPDAAQRNP